MFRRKTLFVLGAGASWEAGLPLGWQLAESIAELMDVRRDGTMNEALNLYEEFRQIYRNEVSKYMHTAWLIRDGIRLSRSIDDFLDLHRHDPQVQEYGKAAIAKRILEAERKSKLYFDPYKDHERGMKVSRFSDTWLVKFMRVLTPGTSAQNIDTAFNNVSFINFNYDRCLEFFLTHALARTHGAKVENTQEIVRKLDIVHPYGKVGDLQITGQGGEIPFGGTADCPLLAKKIKTYTEQIADGDDLKKMRKMIAEAEKIIFLGFAFHEQNMALLTPKEPVKPIPVYATATGFSDDDVEVIRGQIAAFFKNSESRMIRIRNNLKASKLFDAYSKSITN